MGFRDRYSRGGGYSHPSHRPYVPLARRVPTPSERMAGHQRPTLPLRPMVPVDAVTTHLAVSVFATDPRASELVDVIAEAVHALCDRLDGIPIDARPFAGLSDDDRQRYRAHAIALVMDFMPFQRAAALLATERSGFASVEGTVETFLNALKMAAPVRQVPAQPAEPAAAGSVQP